MKKYIYIILLLLIVQVNVFSQELKISYEMNVYPNAYLSYFDLKITDNYSQWEFIGYTDLNNSEEVSIVEPSRPIKFYTIANKHYYEERLLGKYFNVIDHPKLKWELMQKVDSINNYNCQYAKTEFRGRKYTACFSNDIKISEGPWKFKGLPGLIIHIKSDDDFIEYTLLSIAELKKNDFTEEAEKYLTSKFIGFDGFQERFIRGYDNYIKALKSKKENHSFDSYYKIDGTEILYPELQTGQGIAY